MSLTHPVDLAKGLPGLPPAMPQPETRWVELRHIAESPFNPRKDFPEESIAELAESIRQRGLLEPLVVRPAGKDGHFELMAGHRRLRALKLLEADGATCSVIAADDGEARATLIVENLQREDLGPMEEAAAFDELNKADPERWSTANISAAIGKTQRFVQQRLGLVRNLAPETKKHLDEGRLNIEVARTLAATPQSLQKKVIECNSWNLHRMSADHVREAIAEHAIPVAAAAFDPTLYTGEYVEEGKKKYFGDIALFTKLQQQVARDQLAKLKETWPEAKIVKKGELDSWVWGDTGSSVKWNKDHKVAATTWPKTWTALIYLDTDHKIRTAEGVKPKPAPSHMTQRPAAAPYKETPERKAQRERFNTTLQAAVAKDAGVAVRLLLLEIASGRAELNIGPKILKQALPSVTIPGNGFWLTPKQRAVLWTRLAPLKDPVVLKAFTVIGAALIDDDESELWSEHDKDCPAELLAIGATLGVKPEEVKPKLADVVADKVEAKARATQAKPAPAAKKKAAAKKKHQ